MKSVLPEILVKWERILGVLTIEPMGCVGQKQKTTPVLVFQYYNILLYSPVLGSLLIILCDL